MSFSSEVDVFARKPNPGILSHRSRFVLVPENIHGLLNGSRMHVWINICGGCNDILAAAVNRAHVANLHKFAGTFVWPVDLKDLCISRKVRTGTIKHVRQFLLTFCCERLTLLVDQVDFRAYLGKGRV